MHVDPVEAAFGVVFLVLAFVSRYMSFGLGRPHHQKYGITLLGRVLVFCLGMLLLLHSITRR